RWKISHLSVRRLRDFGFLRLEQNGALVFHHQIFFRYFKGHSRLHEKRWAKTLLQRFDNVLRAEYPAQYFLVIEKSRSYAAGDVRHAIETTERDAAALEYLPEFTAAFLRSTAACRPEDRGRLLNGLRAAGQRVKSRIGFGRAFDLLRDIAARELPKTRLYARYGESYFRLALSCANIHVTVREDDGAAAILESALDLFGDFRFKDPQRKREIECALLNRLCVARRSLSPR